MNPPETTAPPACAECGLPLPGGEPTSRCPHCLLNLALGGEGDTEEPRRESGPGARRVKYFGDFELVSELAQGGMGVVWKARQLTINRLVALKMIHAGHLASAEARMRFAAEIEATARLDHPHIVPLYETGEHDGVHFFTMKLLTGGDLTSRREHYLLPPMVGGPAARRLAREKLVEIAVLLEKVARAVHYAHLRGILHRDLKPSNVLLDESGEPHVADFGLAKMLTRESGFTFTQAILGSPNYMAPEQAQGRTEDLTTATDVYGLGAIFYELLTGRPPFRGESPIATLRKVIDEPPIPPRRIHPGVDADLDTICLKCLEKSPTARYLSAEAFADDLNRWIERRPVFARRTHALEQAWRWSQRQPALATALVTCLVLLLIVAIGSSVAAVRVRRAEQAALASLREARLSQARSLRLTSEIGHRSEGLSLLRDANHPTEPEEFRRQVRDELLATLIRTDLEFAPLPSVEVSRDPSFSLVTPRCDQLASLDTSNTVVIVEIPKGRTLRRFSLGPAVNPRLEQFSHDGRFLGVRHQDGIGIWDVETGKPLWQTNGPQRVFAFAPNKDECVVEEWNYQATHLSLPECRTVRTSRATAPDARGRTSGWSAMALSPDGELLAVSRNQDRVTEWINLERDQVVRRITNRAPVVALKWSPDGTRLAAALSNGRVPVYGHRGATSFDLAGLNRVARSLAFNSDGSQLAIVGQDRMLRLIDTVAMRDAFEARCDGGAVAFDVSGTRVGPVFRGRELGWFEIRRPAEFHHVTAGATRNTYDGCHFSPDGRLVAIGNTSEVVLCDPFGSQPLFKRYNWRIGALGFDPTTSEIRASTSTGIHRYRIQSDGPRRVEVSAVDLQMPGSGWRSLAFGPEGHRFVAANIRSNAAYVFDGKLGGHVATLGPHTAPDAVAISPDGRWVATGSSTDRQVRVWDVESTTCLKTVQAGSEPRAAFSPDGRWLAIWGETFTLVSTRDWISAPALPLPDNNPLLGAAAFSPDSRILAVVCDPLSIQLVDLNTFRPLGLLRAPGTAVIRAIQFSPDGNRLASTGQLGRLNVWDLQQIRRRLRELGLDWDWPQETYLRTTR